MQKAFTSDWKNWQFTPGEDAFPVLPSWVDSGNARVVSVQTRTVVDQYTDLR
jgi:hypothetical protein